MSSVRPSKSDALSKPKKYSSKVCGGVPKKAQGTSAVQITTDKHGNERTGSFIRPEEGGSNSLDIDEDTDSDPFEDTHRTTTSNQKNYQKKNGKVKNNNPASELAVVADSFLGETELGLLLKTSFLIEGRDVQPRPPYKKAGCANSSTAGKKKGNVDEPKYFLYLDNTVSGLILWTHRSLSFGGKCTIRKYKVEILAPTALYLCGKEFVHLASSAGHSLLINRITEARNFVRALQSHVPAGKHATFTVLVDGLDKELLSVQLQKVRCHETCV
jgi:hypothetical protein